MWRRLRRDPYAVYTALLAPIALAVALIERRPAEILGVVLFTLIFVGAQAALGLVPARRRRWFSDLGWSFLRLTIALIFVAVVSESVGGPVRPLAAMYLPVVVAAAAIGLRQGIVLGIVASAIYLVPELSDLGSSSAVALRGVALAGVAMVLAMATRRLMGERQAAARALRTAVVEERRRSRQIAAMETVGRLVAAGGPTQQLLDGVLAVLVDRVGYRHVSIYLWDGDILRRGSQRNYAEVPETIPATRGIVGRVASTRELAFIPDVGLDPDYVPVHDGVASEICAPLIVGDEFLGVLNVESITPLDHADRDLIAVLADRVATVVALSNDRQALAARAALFRNLHEFTEAVSGSLEMGQLCNAIVEAAGRVVTADLVAVTVLEPESGRYLIRAATGASAKVIGQRVRPGEGLSGQAISRREPVIADTFGSAAYPEAIRDLADIEIAAGAGIPLIRDDDVVGAITIGRAEAGSRFSPIELEAMGLLAGHASLAIANAFLHARVEELAIRDSLTGLYNRRHFDEALERLLAAHRRDPIGITRPLSAIMFDLDHFGQFNKLHGHQIGDAVLRTFGAVLAERFRASDLVARFGGEEFVVILDGAPLSDAQQVAEEVRALLAERSVDGEEGSRLRVTVSAGCAALDDENPSREALLRTADVALFMAKRAGRDRVVAA